MIRNLDLTLLAVVVVGGVLFVLICAWSLRDQRRRREEAQWREYLARLGTGQRTVPYKLDSTLRVIPPSTDPYKAFRTRTLADMAGKVAETAGASRERLIEYADPFAPGANGRHESN